MGRNQQFDVALKEIVTSATDTLRQIGASDVQRWLNVELPSTRNPRVDLLGETASGRLIHVELQATNDAAMASRMLEYGVAIMRRCGRFPRQVVVYFGRDRMRMKSGLVAEGVRFEYELIDFRDLDRESLLGSKASNDHILALLAGEPDKSLIRAILERFTGVQEDQRRTAAQSLLLISELRDLKSQVRKEVSGMPVVFNLLEHDMFGPVIRQQLKDSREEGREKGREEEARGLVRKQIAKRFGRIPAWAEKRLKLLSRKEIEQLSLELLDAASLKEMFGRADG